MTVFAIDSADRLPKKVCADNPAFHWRARVARTLGGGTPPLQITVTSVGGSGSRWRPGSGAGLLSLRARPPAGDVIQ
jgi:hypothetical protein